MKTNRINFKKLKYGQRVWCIQLGYCKVANTINAITDYPICVKKTVGLNVLYETFTAKGLKDINDKFPSLFLRKPSLK